MEQFIWGVLGLMLLVGVAYVFSEIEEKTAISLAITEKPIKKHRITRRTKMIHVPKIKTRRNR